MIQTPEYILSFILSFFLGYFMNQYFYRKKQIGIFKKTNITGVRWAVQTKPIAGGITFYSLFLCAVISYLLIYNHIAITNYSHFIGLFLIVTISFIMGLADDNINTSPYFKLFIQLLSSIIIIHYNIYIHFFSNDYLNYLLTIFWVIGIMNSINMLDNMDAIATLVSISIIMGSVINIILVGDLNYSSIIFISLIILATLFSFLLFNWFPSKMYMGDNGSQFLGALLSFLGIMFFWNNPKAGTSSSVFTQLLPVILAFLIPLTDTTTVTINRLLKKKSPFVGGKDHIAHYLYYFGLSERWIAVILFLLSLTSVAFSIYLIHYVNEIKTFHILFFGGFALIVFLLLYVNTKITRIE